MAQGPNGQQQPDVAPLKWLERPGTWKALWAVLVFLVGAVYWTGKTAWDANQRLNELRESSRKEAAADAKELLSGYVTTEVFLRWQLSFEREQAARDREISNRLRGLLR